MQSGILIIQFVPDVGVEGEIDAVVGQRQPRRWTKMKRDVSGRVRPAELSRCLSSISCCMSTANTLPSSPIAFAIGILKYPVPVPTSAMTAPDVRCNRDRTSAGGSHFNRSGSSSLCAWECLKTRSFICCPVVACRSWDSRYYIADRHAGTRSEWPFFKSGHRVWAAATASAPGTQSATTRWSGTLSCRSESLIQRSIRAGSLLLILLLLEVQEAGGWSAVAFQTQTEFYDP